jgi:predicted transcriptional regulator
MPTAKDIMTRDVITIHLSASLRDLSRTLTENRITGIPVVDDDNRLVGIISMRDLIREEIRSLGATPDYQDIYELFSSALNMEEAEDIAVRHVWVEEIMSRTLYTADETATLRELCAIMNEHKVHRLPILRDGRLVGLVTATDLIRTIAEGGDV